MRKLFLFTILTLLYFGAISQPIPESNLLKYPLKSIAYFCQDNTETPLSIITLAYDSNNRLEKLITYQGQSIISEVNYYYNEFGKYDYQDIYSFDQTLKLERTKVFHYDENKRLIFEAYEDNKEYSGIKEYTYNEIGQIITCTEKHNSNSMLYTYEYDTYGRLSKQYLNGNILCSYEYSQNLLLKQVKNNRIEIIYEYDNEGLLIKKRENGNIVEENIYKDGLLTEQWSSYFGIDPCFSPCCSQYVATYIYY